jgi:hypothetical protein
VLSANRFFTCFIVYSCLHSLFSPLQQTFRFTFVATRMLSYHAALADGIRGFGILLSPVHFWRKIARPVSYYALFKGWLLLSQPPGCLSNFTSFST